MEKRRDFWILFYENLPTWPFRPCPSVCLSVCGYVCVYALLPNTNFQTLKKVLVKGPGANFGLG